MIKNIVFDIGNVLIDFHWKKTMEELQFSQDAIDVLEKNMVNHSLWHELDLDIMSEDYVFEEFKKISPDYSEQIELFKNNLSEIVTMYEGADEWLKELKKQGFNIYLLSNYPKRMFEMHTERFYFLPYTDGRVVSYEYHLAKPDPAIYNKLIEMFSINPIESIFLDDRIENIEAAQKLGFETILVTDPFEARKALNKKLEFH